MRIENKEKIMATIETPTNRLPTEVEREEAKSAEVVAGGSMVEAIAGVSAVVLAILGLAGLLPVYLLDIATIAVGLALLFEGGAIAVRYSRLLSETVGSRLSSAELGGGMGVEVLGGIAGIVLGILALLGLMPLTLASVAAIVFGGTLLMSSGTTSRLNCLIIDGHGWPDTARRVAREAVLAAASVQVLVGLAGGILGLLALLGIYPLELALVAMLCLGASVLLSGTAISSKMLSVLHHR
jgi:hypothetical protein